MVFSRRCVSMCLSTFVGMVVSSTGGLQARAEVVAIAGQIEFLAEPPPSLSEGQLTSEVGLFAIAEQHAVVLPGHVNVDINRPGEYDQVGELTGGKIGAGVVVDSYFLHADRTQEGSFKRFVGSMTFDTEILGVMILPQRLNQSDDLLGVPGTVYMTARGQDDFRGLELNQGDDLVILSEDRHTITVQSHIKRYRDQIRVVTAADTTPPTVECSADTQSLFPPNHKMVAVTIAVEATDAVTDAADLELVGVFAESNEPDDGLGDGDTPGDVNGQDGFVLDGVGTPVDVTAAFDADDSFVDADEAGSEWRVFPGTILLRAERAGIGEGRVYAISALVADRAGNVAEATCQIVVPHDRRKAK